MSDWAIEETKMLVERIQGTDGTPGWTVSWKGRGWYDTFEKYLEFFDEALAIGNTANMSAAEKIRAEPVSVVDE